MPRRSCALALVTVALATAGAADAEPRKRTGAAVAPAEKRAADTLRRARAVFDGPARGRRREATPALVELALRLPALEGSALTEARGLLARPTDGLADPSGRGYTVPEAAPVCSARFCVHYVTTSRDAPSTADGDGNGAPDYAERVLGDLEHSHATSTGPLGWAPPRSDVDVPGNGGDGRIDVYLAEIGSVGLYGYAATDIGQTGSSRSGYLVLDNDYSPTEFPYASPDPPRQVTTAHELGHLFQFSYDVAQDAWMAEATSTWLEDAVFPSVNDYLQYLPSWAESPEVSITRASPDKVYGDAVWNMWLASRLGSRAIERSWAASTGTDPPSLAPLAYESGIASAGGTGLADEFGAFTAAAAEWQSAGFTDGLLFPEVARAGSLDPDGQPARTALDHGSFALYDVPAEGRETVTLEVSGPPGTLYSIALVGRRPDGSVVVRRSAGEFAAADPAATGNASTTLERASEFARVTAVLANTDFRVDGFSTQLGDWIWGRDRAAFSAGVAGRAARPAVELRSPRTQRADAVARRGLLVSVLNRDPTPSRVSVRIEVAGKYLRAAGAVGRSGPFEARGDRATRIRVKLNAAARRALARRRSTPFHVRTTVTGAGGSAPAHARQRVTVVR